MAALGDRPLVSVCIATYGQARFLDQCVQSVFDQATDIDGALEVLVGDDCSPDDTPAVLQQLKAKFGDALIVVRHEPNIGPAENYRALIGLATGRFIAHLDGDDYWNQGKLAQQIDFLEGNADCASVCTNAEVIDEEGNRAGVFTADIEPKISLDYLLEGGNFLNHSSLLYRDSVKSKIHALKAPFIDYRLMVELAKAGQIGFIDRRLVVYRANMAASIQKTRAGQMRQLYFDALLAGLKSANQQAGMNAAATYVAYKVVFSILDGAPTISGAEVSALLAQLGRSRLALFLRASVRMVSLVLKFGAARLRHSRNKELVHHPRY